MNKASSGIREKHGTAVWHAVFMAIAGAAILWLGWQFRALYVELQRIRSHDYRLVELTGEIIHLDEVLTMSARMAVATLDPAWENRYHRFEPQLDEAIKESIRLEPGTVGKFIAETDMANRELVQMEERSFDFVHRKDQHGAAAILLSHEYERQKKFYSDGMQRLAAAANVRADANMAAQQERMYLVFVIFLVVLAVLFLFWIALSRANGRRFRAERRAKQHAALAWDESEIRVADATADLRKSRGLLQDIIDRSPLLIYATDLEGRFVLANRNLESLLGVSQGGLTGKVRHTLLLAELADQHRVNDLEVVQTGRPIALEEEYSEPNRRRVYYTVKFPLIDSAGKTYAIGGISTDITERKRAEVTLRAEQHKLDMVTQNIGAGLAIISRDYRTVWANNVLKKIFGDVEGKSCHLAFNHQDAVCPGCGVKRVFEHGEEVAVHEQSGKDTQGETIWSEIIATPIRDEEGTITHALELVVPITERKRAEEALRESLERFNQITEQSREMIWEVDNDGLYTLASDVSEAILGYRPDELIGKKHFYDLHPEAGREAFKTAAFKVFACKGRFHDLENLGQTKDGRIVWLSINGRPILDANGNLLGYRGSDSDITERKRAEEEVRDSETRYRTLFEASADGILIADIETKAIQYANPALCRMLGYTAEELKTMSVPDIHPKDAMQHVLAQFEALARGEKTLTADVACLGKDGTTTHVNIAGTSATIDRRVCSVAFFRDITERKRAEEEIAQLEEQFQQAQKMESIGRLASGVAHDFNNLLAVIMGQSELLAARLGPDDSLSAPILEIDAAAQRASSLTRQLLAFSRRQAWEPKVIDLNACVSNMDKMLRRLIGEEIELTSLVGPSLGSVLVDPIQIEQVIMNLVVNARDAMPRGGKITIRTESLEIPDGTGDNWVGVPPGPYVLLAVNDTGHGIDELILNHIFEPFFTTKELGKGTGLGLSTVYGIVERSGGHIDVESTIGVGTTFTVLLPLVSAVEESAKENIGDTSTQVDGETILIVEDEPGVRNIVRTTLEMVGYAVLTAENAGDALALVQDREGAIDLLITDVVMPGLSGPDLVRSMAALWPGIPVIYMSGYADDAIISDAIGEPGYTLLHKPFRLDSLKRAVQAALSAAHQDAPPAVQGVVI